MSPRRMKALVEPYGFDRSLDDGLTLVVALDPDRHHLT